ncbi:MAG: hypothetical protein AMJ65_05050, partial [Phycisphaerae bacterium SG8_4]
MCCGLITNCFLHTYSIYVLTAGSTGHHSCGALQANKQINTVFRDDPVPVAARSRHLLTTCIVSFYAVQI